MPVTQTEAHQVLRPCSMKTECDERMLPACPRRLILHRRCKMQGQSRLRSAAEVLPLPLLASAPCLQKTASRWNAMDAPRGLTREQLVAWFGPADSSTSTMSG